MWVVAFRHKTDHGDWQFIPRVYGWLDACYAAITKRKEIERMGIMDPESTCVVPCELYISWEQAIPISCIKQVEGKNFVVEVPPPQPETLG